MTAHVLDRLRATVEARPDAIAIACAGEPALTYATLWARATAVAGELTRAGVAPGDLIALHLERSPAFVVGMLACWFARAAWVPVVPELPAYRQQQIVEDTAARIALVASDRVPGWLAARCRIVDLRDRFAAPAPAHAALSIEDRAYVIYTSGSTGEPKGVVVSHRGLVPMLDAQIAAFELRPGDRCLWMLSPGFDASVSDVGTALLAGATLHVEHPARLGSARGILEVLRQRAITHVDLPPSLLPLLPADEAPPALRTIVVGGEVCAPAAIRAWAARVRVIDVYGPTEATVCTTLIACDPAWDRPLLGTPLPHVELGVVDDELWITGPGVADGYLDRPALEAAKFVQIGKVRWFRTGDRVRWVDHAGAPVLEFVGRIDRQLKLAGVLVAPEELEARLREVAGVGDALVVAEQVGNRERLVAYYVAAADLGTGPRDHLASRIDPRALPARFVRVDELPRSPTGKRTATPDRTRGALAEIWTELLGVVPRPDDDFFALGGDSLAVIEHVALAELAGLAMTAELLYAQPTLAGLTAAIAAGAEVRARSCDELIADVVGLRPATRRPRRSTPLVLTGATGFLGARVLGELLARGAPAITCLVREPARLAPILRELDASRVTVVAGDLAQPLADAVDAELAGATVVHCAAEVSLARPYGALRATNVVGTSRVLALAGQVHHASTLSVLVGGDHPGSVDEATPLEHAGRVHGGYAQSKWAAEWLAREAGATIYRFGLLTGDTETGRAPPRDWLTWFVRGLARVGAVPRGAGELRVDITPVDHAARALATLVLAGATGTFHVANPRSATLDELVLALRRAGVAIAEVEPDAWPERVTTAELALPEVAAALLGLCRTTDGYPRGRTYDVFQATGFAFDTARVDAAVGRCPPPSEALLDRYVAAALGLR